MGFRSSETGICEDGVAPRILSKTGIKAFLLPQPPPCCARRRKTLSGTIFLDLNRFFLFHRCIVYLSQVSLHSEVNLWRNPSNFARLAPDSMQITCQEPHSFAQTNLSLEKLCHVFELHWGCYGLNCKLKKG